MTGALYTAKEMIALQMAMMSFVEETGEVIPMSEEAKRSYALGAAMVTVKQIIKAQPSYVFWETYSDETPSAITFFNEVKAELEKMKL